ncbi:MAG: argininosuccinate lyase [Bacteroidota bacterium]
MSRWKGGFREPLDPAALEFSSSLSVDRRLAEEDIEGSLAHVAMLAAQGIIPRSDARKITHGLKQIREEIAGGKADWLGERDGDGRFVAEDIHMAIERRVIALTGDAGARLHTARSRNDQVALDERLYLRKAIDRSIAAIRGLQRSLLAKATEYRDVVMPGYTHLQRAQPILLAHHLLAYIEMLERDRERFLDCRKRVNRSPLGAAALAGTSFPINRRKVARMLGFDGLIVNSIDAVSDRDVLIEFISSAAITMMHASRLSEELVLWTTREWRFAEIGDAFTTGSSIMPQKKNPDMAELVRGKTGRVYGDLVALLTVMKGLPLAYNRDMQEDKEPLFDAADTVTDSLDILARMLGTVRFDKERFEVKDKVKDEVKDKVKGEIEIKIEIEGDEILATELADYLVRKSLPFREAHGIVGAIVALCKERKCSLGELPIEEYRRHSPAFGNDVKNLLTARGSVGMKRSEGSTSPAEVAKALRAWTQAVKKP